MMRRQEDGKERAGELAEDGEARKAFRWVQISLMIYKDYTKNLWKEEDICQL